MTNIKLFTKSTCSYCHRAMDLLTKLNVNFTNIEVDNGNDEWEEQKEKTGHKIVPMIFIDGDLIGGYDDLLELTSSGKLQEILTK